MLASINPLGERARNMVWGRTVSWYAVGSLAGGAVAGAIAGAIGRGLHAVLDPSPTSVAVVVVAACMAGLVLDLRVGGARLPSIRRQVNEDWLPRYRGWVYGLGFGFQLGLGVATIVTTASVYLTFVLAAAPGSVLAGLAIGAVFGLVRAIPVLTTANVHDPGALRSVLRRADALTPIAARATHVVLAATLVVGVTTIVA